MKNIKLLSLLLLIHYASLVLSAQKRMALSLIDSIDKATLKVEYLYIQQEGATITHDITLQIGKQVSKCLGKAQHLRDSLSLALGNQQLQPQEMLQLMSKLPKSSSQTSWRVYRNYPKGMVSITDRVLTDYYLSETELAPISWQIDKDSTKDIGGYKYLKASGYIGGRIWTVWYAPEIAYPSGPWLLVGLPGLILEAKDDSKTHEFRFVSITQSTAPIGFEKHNFFKASYPKVIKQMQRYYKDAIQYSSGSIYFPKGVAKNAKQIKDRPFNPLWLPE